MKSRLGSVSIILPIPFYSSSSPAYTWSHLRTRRRAVTTAATPNPTARNWRVCGEGWGARLGPESGRMTGTLWWLSSPAALYTISVFPSLMAAYLATTKKKSLSRLRYTATSESTPFLCSNTTTALSALRHTWGGQQRGGGSCEDGPARQII